MEVVKVHVLIVDDQAPFRNVARTVVGVTKGFEVVGEAGTGEEAIDMVGELRPDLVLMDINMPGIDGIEATRRITGRYPATSVILLSTYAESDLPADAGRCGALAYVHKEDFGPRVIRDLWSGRAVPSEG